MRNDLPREIKNQSKQILFLEDRIKELKAAGKKEALENAELRKSKAKLILTIKAVVMLLWEVAKEEEAKL